MDADSLYFNNFSNLTGLVALETNRPDLVQQTAAAVIASTQKMHGMDYWWKDRLTATFVFDTPAYIQTIDIQGLPRFRDFGEDGLVRKWDASFNAYEQDPTNLPPLQANSLGVPINPFLALKPLKRIDPDDLLDWYSTEKVDVFYKAGGTVFIKSSTSLVQAQLVYYGRPILDVTHLNSSPPCPAYSSWIAAEFPYAIIYDATSSILQKIGMTDAARKYDAAPDPRTGFTGGLVWNHINNLKLSNIR